MKVYKTKDNKYIVYLPDDVIKQFGVKGDEDVEFLKFSDSAFLFAKKVNPTINFKPMDLTLGEINVLKKLDTLRYANRTAPNVAKILNETEKKSLQGLINKRAVWLSQTKGSYGISKEVYDKFLMRKKPQAAPQSQRNTVVIEAQAPRIVMPPIKIEKNENVMKLETDGFIVLSTEAEASSLSFAVEDSIRSGKVLGIRAFNKKFYIIMRSFFDKNNAKVIKELREGPKNVAELVKKTDLDEDAIRAMLYLLSEQGDVSERRKDIFTLI